MTSHRLSLLALLLIVPVALDAQGRRGGGGGSAGGAGAGGGAPPADDCRAASGGGRGLGAGGDAAAANRMIRCMSESPSLSKDLQKANPIETLLDAKKDLGLSKDEEKELKTLNDDLKDAVKPFFKSIDSVVRENKKEGDYAPTQGQMMLGRSLTRESTDSVMTKYRAATEAAIAKLAEPHRQAATDLLQKQMEAQMARSGGRPPR